MTTAPDPFDHLHDALVASAHERPAPTAGRRWRPTQRVAILATVGLLVGGTAVAATVPWSPKLGGDRRDDQVTRATQPLPQAQIDALGVLRRPQSAADRTPAVEQALRRVSHLGAGLHVDGIRKLRDHVDGTVLLIPLQRVGPKDAPAAARIRDGLCIFRTNETLSFAGAGCGTVADLKRGRIRSITDGLVPDGVRRVRVTLTTGKVLTADVKDNYYELPYTFPESPLPGTHGVSFADAQATSRKQLAAMRRINGRPIRWLDAHGDVVPKTYR